MTPPITDPSSAPVPVDPGTAVIAAWPHVVAVVARMTGDPAAAEDAAGEAVARLLAQASPPASVEAWLVTAARRIAIDEMRRSMRERMRLAALVEDSPPVVDRLEASYGDERLAMLHVACDPGLPPETRLALALRFVLGIPTVDVADVLLVRPAAMSARLTRAKQHLAAAGLEGAAPGERRDDMLAVLHAVFTLSYAAPAGSTLDVPELQASAVELIRRHHRHDPHPESAGLLALALFTTARRATRSTPLETADRSLWDRAAILEALPLATSALSGGGRFALEAGIAGLHSTAVTWSTTDWPAVAALYDRLVDRWPSPSARLARAIARSHLSGGLPGTLVEIDAVVGAPPRHVAAARADALRRLGRDDEARREYGRAILLEGNAAVRAWLSAQCERCGSASTGDADPQ